MLYHSDADDDLEAVSQSADAPTLYEANEHLKVDGFLCTAGSSSRSTQDMDEVALINGHPCDCQFSTDTVTPRHHGENSDESGGCVKLGNGSGSSFWWRSISLFLTAAIPAAGWFPRGAI